MGWTHELSDSKWGGGAGGREESWKKAHQTFNKEWGLANKQDWSTKTKLGQRTLGNSGCGITKDEWGGTRQEATRHERPEEAAKEARYKCTLFTPSWQKYHHASGSLLPKRWLLVYKTDWSNTLSGKGQQVHPQKAWLWDNGHTRPVHFLGLLCQITTTGWLKTAVYSLTVWEAEVWKQGVGKIGSFWKLWRIYSMPLSYLLLLLSLETVHSNLRLLPMATFPLCVFLHVSSLLIRISPVIVD